MTYSNIVLHWYRGGSFSLEDGVDWTTMICEQEIGGFKLADMILERRQRRIDRVINHLPVAQLDELVLGRQVAFWRQFVDHPSADDPFWQPVDHSGRVAAVTVPVLQVGGWYDIFLPEQLADHHALVAAGNHPRLVIGPWTHISPDGFKVQVRESLRWLDQHVRGVPAVDRGAGPLPVRIFVMGANRWRDVASWPSPGYPVARWYLQSRGRLDRNEPGSGEPDSYTYDPADPTPIVGGTLMRRSGGRRDQARTERRRDVLLFTSDVLTRDVEVIGEVFAEIHVSSDLEHFDVFVRLCDVDSKGRSFNVCDGIERVSPLRRPRSPGGIWAVRVALWPTAQLFPAGHRIRVQVGSGAHPRFVRNLGTGEPLASGTAMRVAHQRIYHDREHPSAVFLPVQEISGS
jgi:putative CocE/NonD family hydrolase